MKKLIVLSLGIFFISGCLVRTYTIYKPRVDTKVTGNRGYIVGKPKEGEEAKKKKSSLGKMRPVTVFEIELGAHPPKSIVTGKPEEVVPLSEKNTENNTDNNAALKQETSASSIEKEINRPENVAEEIVPVSSIEEKPAEKYKYYTVQKNDTLQKISRKFYGTTRKWKLIYQENKDVIKNPDRVYPGLKIKVPQLK